MSIRLSEKHGINAMIPRCFWCDESKNEILLLGRLKGDAKAPHGKAVDYEPCDNCSAQWERGIAIIEVAQQPAVENQQPMPVPGVADDGSEFKVFPTGRWAVITREVVARLITPPSLRDEILKKGKTFVAAETWDSLGLRDAEAT